MYYTTFIFIWKHMFSFLFFNFKNPVTFIFQGLQGFLTLVLSITPFLFQAFYPTLDKNNIQAHTLPQLNTTVSQ